jgi:hypothetical protein
VCLCDHDKEISDTVKSREFIDPPPPSDPQLLKKDYSK